MKTLTRFALLCAVVILASVAGAQVSTKRSQHVGAVAAVKPNLLKAYGRLPLHLEPNVGQADSEVCFLSRGTDYTLLLMRSAEAVLLLDQSRRGPHESLRVRMVGAKASTQVEALEQFTGKANYFIGKDPNKWHANVPLYGRVKMHDVYDGIDVAYYGNQQQLEQDIIVAPRANPKAVSMLIEGGRKLSLDEAGNLVVGTTGGKVLFRKPFAYQESRGVRHEVPTSYLLTAANEFTFQVGTYDHNQALVIDPVLAYSTLVGGSVRDHAEAIAVDTSGNAYITGGTTSPDFPTAAAFQGSLLNSDFGNAFVTKVNASGTALIYSTYLGGTSGDSGTGIQVDSGGNAYVTGSTGSTDFPTTLGAFQSGPGSSFVTKLNAAGSALVYSTYLGNGGGVIANTIALDSSGNAYVSGTASAGFLPTTAGAFETNPTAGFNAFVTKFNATGSALVYSTYLGGSFFVTQGNDIAIDSVGNAYVTGNTFDGGFPTTPGAFQTTFHSTSNGQNGFVSKLNATGSALVYSTYLGGSVSDEGLGIAVDSAGSAYVTGFAESTDFPTQAGSFQTTNPDPGLPVGFVTKLNAAGSALVYSTFLGGTDAFETIPHRVRVDSAGNAYVTGFTGQATFPVTANAVQATLGGDDDIFVTTLNPSGTTLVFSSYFGGISEDFGGGIALDSTGSAYIAGNTFSNSGFPTTAGAFQSSATGQQAAFVAKIADIAPPAQLGNFSASIIVSSELRTTAIDGKFSPARSIDPLHQAVSLSVGASNNFSQTFAPGMFHRIFGGYVASATSGSSKITMLLLPLRNGQWSYSALISRYMPGSNPVSVSLAIGAQSGSATVNARVF